MAKKTKTQTPAPAAGETQAPTTAPAPATTPKVKKEKAPKVEIALTPAQQAAKDAMDKANAEARAELLAKSGEKIALADQKIKDAIAAVKVAKAERKALNKALGIKGVFGGKKVSTLVYVKDFPEGKGAPQAKQILEIVKAGAAAGVAREKVVETMKTAINTKMDRSRLLSFYTSRMVEAGVIETK